MILLITPSCKNDSQSGSLSIGAWQWQSGRPRTLPPGQTSPPPPNHWPGQGSQLITVLANLLAIDLPLTGCQPRAVCTVGRRTCHRSWPSPSLSLSLPPVMAVCCFIQNYAKCNPIGSLVPFGCLSFPCLKCLRLINFLQ